MDREEDLWFILFDMTRSNGYSRVLRVIASIMDGDPEPEWASELYKLARRIEKEAAET